MELMEDPVFKSKYHKCKLRVKLWESDFMDKYGRRPNKNDIKEADVSIKDAYKMYWKLKTQVLDESLTDITFTDDVQTNVPKPSPAKPAVEDAKQVKKPEMKDAKKDTENIDPHLAPVLHSDAPKPQEPECKNVQGVWGNHLSKSNEGSSQRKQNLLVGRSSSFQLSQNKFTGSAFTKRNPRKSLSMTKLRNKLDKSIDVSTENLTEQPNATVKDGLDGNEETKLIFGDAVKVTYAENKPATQPINTVQQLMDGHTINRNLNTGWLDRCAKQNNLNYPAFNSQRLSGTSDSGIESMECSIYSPKESRTSLDPPKALQLSDDEEFVGISDSEEERTNKRIRNFKKRLSDQDVQPSKRLCLESSPASITAKLPRESANTTTAIHAAPNKTQISIDSTNHHKSVNNNVANSVAQPDVQNNENMTDNINSRTNLPTKDQKTEDHPETKSKEKTANADTEETNVKAPPEKPVRRRRVLRRIKHVSSDDSDPEYAEESAKTVKKKEPKATKARAPRRSKNTEKSSTGKKRAPRKKQNVDEENEGDKEDEETAKETGPQIYGIETLHAVPRFALQKDGDGDLIEQFSKTVSLTMDNKKVLPTGTKAAGKLTDKEKLEKKVADGKINENFVRINLKKKVFVRGKKNFNFSKFKKNQWKQRKKELASGEGSLDLADLAEKNAVLTCFKCGGVGHFSRMCPNARGDDLIPLEEVDDSSGFPTLEEAQKMASQNAKVAHGNRIDRLPQKPSYSSQTEGGSTEAQVDDQFGDDEMWEVMEDEEILCGHKIPEELVSRLLPPEIGTVNPLYPVGGDQSLIATPSEVFETLRMFGHESFRAGQEKAVMRILSGQSTLVTLSTGSGKSLCYQLPAYMYSKHFNCITLVISPLVSLMDDQVTGVPSFLSAACLHTSQTPKVRDNVMQMVKQGKLNILLVSPEAVVAGEKSTGFGALLRQLPPIAFACIDEAHCISQWSHNFRPSYLMVCRVLKEKLGVKTVLALTATATKTTAESIVRHLGIHDGTAGIISDVPMPKNLLLTVSKDVNRDHALINLLRSERFQECNSVIVYCTRREECARIAALLRTSLQDVNNPERSNVKLSSIAEAYHAGLSSYRRKTVQKAFMSGQTRIVVATVAFGMGLNKPDIRSVIHYNMPGTFESYVQEVGRAGRDGLPSHCHLFLSPTEDNDKWELRRHIYANGVDRHTIRRLLHKVFVPCSCATVREKGASRKCPGHEVAIPVDETVAALDIPEETISTLLCYLELHPKRFITVLSSVYVRARLSSYNGPQALKVAAQNSPPLAMAIALDLQKGISHDDSSVIEFPVVDIASAIGWDSGVVKSHLKNLEWKTVNGASKRSAISVRYDTLGLRVRAPGDLTEDELDEALDALVSRAQSQETAALLQLETIGKSLHGFSEPMVTRCLVFDENMARKSDDLKTVIRNYFQTEISLDADELKKQEKIPNEAEIIGDVRSLIMSYRDNNFTGRAVARIFHGIQSPNYPAFVWGKCRYWRSHLSCNFNILCQIATKEILALR